LQAGRLFGKLLQHEKTTAQAVFKILIIFPFILPNNKKNAW
jgi:hypothetical protein